MDSDDPDSALMDVDTDASEKDLGLDGPPALTTPPTAQDLDAPEKDLGLDGLPATTPPNASDLDAVTTSDIKPDDHRREQGHCNQLNGQG